jgi:hypothetical protein
VSGTFDPEAPRDRWLEQPLVVARGARRPRGDDDRWRAATSARSGTIATFDGVDRVARTIEAGGTRPRLPERRFPMRSAWWLLPFAACLGGEWWLRRRAGLR